MNYRVLIGAKEVVFMACVSPMHRPKAQSAIMISAFLFIDEIILSLTN